MESVPAVVGTLFYFLLKDVVSSEVQAFFMRHAIETRELSYAFHPKIKVVNNLSLQVPEGSIYGFLGPNGAGKTTTIRLLAGMLPSEVDSIFLLGKSLQKNTPSIFSSVGCLIETPSLYLHLSGKENLRVITTLRGLPAANCDKVLQTVGLTAAANRKVKEYSLGMKQRLGIAMALLPDPSLLILDEPVNGLDPNGIIEIRELLIKLNKEEGKTVFISSHLLHEIEKTCTHIGIINKGVLRYQGTLEDMKAYAYKSGEVIFRMNNTEQWFESIREKFGNIHRQGQEEILFPFQEANDVPRINEQLVHMGVPVTSIQIRGGLEDWFMKIIQSDPKASI